MKIKSATFVVSAPSLRACPPSAAPEFAFIGRSNVGKSSLINMLVEQRELAKVSDTPGKTRLLNFYLINGAWSVVDLPGYGFAKGSRDERADFNEAVADYIENRPNLAHVFVLIDSRLPPQQIDVDFLAWLAGCRIPFSLVFTKTDKQPSQVQASVSQFQKRLHGEGIAVPAVFTSSAVTRKGRAELLAYIEQTLVAPPRKPTEGESAGAADGHDDGGPEVW